MGGLVKLGQFTADASLAIAKGGEDISEGVVQTRAGLEQDKRGRIGGEFTEESLPRRRFIGQEAGEEETIGRQAGQAQGRQHRRGAGDRVDLGTGLLRFADQPETRIVDQRRAGIGHLGDDLALRQPFEDFRQNLVAGMIIVAQQFFLKIIGRQQLAGYTGILGQHDVGGAQYIKRAQGDIAQIPDWRSDDIEAGRDGARRRGEKRFHDLA